MTCSTPQRGSISNPIYPVARDVMTYLVRGNPIRAYIRHCAAEVTPSVVLLGNSLRGIAPVDLLVQDVLPQVAFLATAGSQTPFLYETNAPHTLTYGQLLQAQFRPWLKLSHLRDCLSYAGKLLFPGRVHYVQSDRGELFPESRSAYKGR